MNNREVDLLPLPRVLSMVARALERRIGFSLVRLGDGENLCLAHDVVMPMSEVGRESWTRRAPTNHGVNLPDPELRRRLVASVRSADVVGVHSRNDRIVLTAPRLKRALADRVLAHHGLRPKHLCDACITRVLPQRREFWSLLRGRRILLLSRWADAIRPLVQKPPYGLQVTVSMPFGGYPDIASTLDKIAPLADRFDVALVSCGISAVILAPAIASRHRKVALDFGKAMQFMVEGKAGVGFGPSRHAPHTL